jgi:hypothetical protein
VPMQARGVQIIVGGDLVTRLACRQPAVDLGPLDMLAGAAFSGHLDAALTRPLACEEIGSGAWDSRKPVKVPRIRLDRPNPHLPFHRVNLQKVIQCLIDQRFGSRCLIPGEWMQARFRPSWAILGNVWATYRRDNDGLLGPVGRRPYGFMAPRTSFSEKWAKLETGRQIFESDGAVSRGLTLDATKPALRAGSHRTTAFSDYKADIDRGRLPGAWTTLPQGRSQKARSRTVKPKYPATSVQSRNLFGTVPMAVLVAAAKVTVPWNSLNCAVGGLVGTILRFREAPAKFRIPRLISIPGCRICDPDHRTATGVC